MAKKCLGCGVELPFEYIIEQQLQQDKENFTAERPFLAPTDFVARFNAIKQLESKKYAIQDGYCSVECQHEADEIMQEQINGYNHTRGL